MTAEKIYKPNQAILDNSNISEEDFENLYMESIKNPDKNKVKPDKIE